MQAKASHRNENRKLGVVSFALLMKVIGLAFIMKNKTRRNSANNRPCTSFELATEVLPQKLSYQELASATDNIGTRRYRKCLQRVPKQF